jgi:diguanylate cyclase (GGDEF)-like protein
VYTTKQGVIADTIGTQADTEARPKFWLAHMQIGFGILLLETLVAMVYLVLTPAGPHRPMLWVTVAIWFVGAATGVCLAPVIARRSWRSTYSVTWTVASTYAVGLVAVLDGGMASPLLLLLFLPLVYGTLMSTPREATACGASALLSVVLVVVVDRHLVAMQGRTYVLSAALAGAATLSVAASIHWTHIEEHEQSLLAELAGLAGTDELTGCSVRRVLGQHMDQEIERALRTGRPLSLLMIDVDEFKTVNDEYGHVVGDRVLMSIGAILLANVRSFDVASRLGGDEFALLLPEIDTSGAVIVAERICRDLAGSGEVRVTLSIGVSGLNPSMPTAERLVAEADMALDQVKRAGRDAIAVRSPGPLLTW